MKTTAAIAFLSLIACASFAAETEAPPAEADPLAELVRGLSSESFREREDATRALWDEGDAALKTLREASVSDDPETAKRAAEVLEKVELRITPETAPEILEQIRRYRTAPANLKANHINELRRRKAYFQLLKLYSLEKRPESKAELAPLIRGVAMLGAREALAADDFGTAVQLLRMSAKEPNDLMALAWVYRSMGKLGEGMEDPPTPDGVATEDWKITLMRAKGDLDGAIRMAVESKQGRLFAGLKVLEGDPTLWVRQNGFGDHRARALEPYIDIALKRWEGKQVKEADFAPLLEILKEHDSDGQEQAVASLASLGRLAEVEEYQAREQPDTAFFYHLSQERIDKALEIMGLDPEEPDYTAWAAERFAKLARDEEGDEEDSLRMRLVAIAGFLETRGLSKELEAAYSAPLLKFAGENQDGFLDLMRSLFLPGTGAPRFATATGITWAGDDANRWGELFSAVFGEDGDVREWLAWMESIEPGMSRPDSFRAIMALFEVGSDPQGLAEQWLDKAWKAAEEGPGEARNDHLQRIRTLAVARQDVVGALKTWDALEGDAKASAKWRSFDKYLSAAGRWKEAAAELVDGRDASVGSPEYHAYLATTLRRAGSEKRAAKHDALADKLSLGYAPTCSRIGDLYVYGGEIERAAEWYRRAAFQADVSSNDFLATLDAYARSMLEQGRWHIAASCYEALAQSYASEQFSGRSTATYSKARLSADLAKALAVLPDDRGRAIALLDGIHRNFKTDGLLADDFFPLLRKVGLNKELEKWFGESWAEISAVVERFPECDNTRNTAAWLASRAGMRLPEAEKHLQAALAKNPGQAAYLDTMAEVRFAMGDRAGAVKWSDLSLLRYPLTDPTNGMSYDAMIRKQNHRFHNEPLP
jgi:hypothetical protein